MIRMDVIHGPERGLSFSLHDHPVVVGRSEDNDIQIKDKGISRHHIRLLIADQKCFVEDLKSKNGTFVMGKPIPSGQKIEVAAGYYIAIGNTVIALEAETMDDRDMDADLNLSTIEISVEKLKDLYKDRPLTYVKNMELIYNALEAIMGSLNLSDVFETVMGYIFDIFKRIDRGAILLINHKTGQLEQIISRSRYDEENTLVNYSRSIVNKVIKEGRATMISDLRQEDLQNASDTVKLIRSVMCVPLISKSGVQGVIYVDSLGKPHGFRSEDLFLLTALSNSGAITIENARLYKDMEQIVEARTASLRKTEKRLRESESRLKAIFDNMSSGVMVCRAVNGGADFKILDLNRAAAKIENTNRKNALGQQLTEQFPFVKASGLFESIQRVSQTGKPERRSITISRDAEAIGWREYYFYRLPSAEIVAIFDDVTQEKRAEERQKDLQQQLFMSQKMESIGLIASGVAHNFRNILQAISGNMEYLELAYSNHPEIKETVGCICQAVDKGADLTTDLMHFAQRAGGYRFVDVDLSDVVMKTYEIVSRIFDKKIDIKFDLENNLYVKGDQSLLSQVFMNLFTNAKDAMPSGGALIIETKKNPNRMAEVVITDTGCGMDKETLEKIFDPFFTLKEVGKGTGLGLSTSHGIIKKHGGTISATSAPGKGTSFTIGIPLTEPVQPEKPAPPQAILFGKGEKVLIVDDDPPVLDGLKNLIEKLNYRAIPVQKSTSAPEAYLKWKPDIVLMDRNMPEMDGITCIRKIMEVDPGAKVVIISGYDDKGPDGIDEDVRKVIKGYISKPCDLKTLTDILSKNLTESRAPLAENR